MVLHGYRGYMIITYRYTARGVIAPLYRKQRDEERERVTTDGQQEQGRPWRCCSNISSCVALCFAVLTLNNHQDDTSSMLISCH